MKKDNFLVPIRLAVYLYENDKLFNWCRNGKEVFLQNI